MTQAVSIRALGRAALDMGVQLYASSPRPCAYLPDRYERRAFTVLDGPDAEALGDVLTMLGFRRSQTLAYSPACSGCAACVPVRIPVEAFVMTRRWRKLVQRNAGLRRVVRPPRATEESYELFARYIGARHGDGGMAEMDRDDFTAMVEESPLDTVIVEYRQHDEVSGQDKLIAAALCDRGGFGLSMVYSWFDPDRARASLGMYMIADHVQMAREHDLPHVYLGYWVSGSSKMDYKGAIRPLEALIGQRWMALDAPGA